MTKKLEKKLMSEDRKRYLRKKKFRKIEILATQILIVVAFIGIWELLARLGKIDSFITSQPSRIVKTFLNLSSNDLGRHLRITCIETLVGFSLGTIMGVIIAIILWSQKKNWKSRIAFKNIGIIVAVGVVGMVLFYLSASLIGRSNDKNLFKYVTTYAGGSIECLNHYVIFPIEGEKSDIVGNETFYTLLQSLDKYKITHTNIAEKQTAHLSFRYYYDSMIGNVYTAYRRWHHDFGWIGIIVLNGIMAAVFAVGYYIHKYKPNMKFNEELDPEGKGRFSIIDNWIPLADEIVADPTTLIRFAENAPGETWAGILDDIKKIQLPILVLHGLNDGWISPVEAVQIAKAARNNADIILFKGLGHSLSKVSSPLKDEGGTIEDEVIVRVVKWLKKNVE